MLKNKGAKLTKWAASSCVVLAGGGMMSAQAQEILPFPPKPSGSIAGRTIQDSVYSPLPATRHLPKDAPNVLIVIIDDVGPGQSSTFGGEIPTPATRWMPSRMPVNW